MKKKIVCMFFCTLLISVIGSTASGITSNTTLQEKPNEETIPLQILKVVDQSQETDNEHLYIPTGTFQGFVPQRKKLVAVEVKIGHWMAEFSSPQITLKIEKPFGNVITSATVSTSDVPNLAENDETGWVFFDVNDVQLTKGETYFIVLYFNLNSDFAWSGAYGDPYPPAQSSMGGNWDFCFRTYFRKSLDISGSKNNENLVNPGLLSILERFPNAFPLLRQLVGY
jgi:hypothetical protein